MANATIKITQLPSIGNGLSASTILPVVNTTGTAVTDKTTLGNIANLILTQAGNTLPPAFVANLAYTVVNSAQPNITSVGNLSINTLHIAGGTNGQYLQTDGEGNLAWVAGGGSGNGVVGGSTGQIQFNNAGDFGGSASLVWDQANALLSTTNIGASHATIYGNVDTINVNATGNVKPNAIYTDHYYYANGYVFGGGGGNGVPGGATTQVQFNDNGVFAGNTGFTFNKTSGLLSATLLAGGGNGLSNIQGANVTGFVANANVANTAFAVAGANVSGAVQYAGTANSVAVANVVGIGNIATVALSGSSSNVLYGNGVWAPAGGANTGNVTFDNINIIGTGNLNLQPDPANSGSYLDIFLSSGPDIHIVASAGANLILGKDDQSNVMTSWDGNVYIQSWDNNTNTQGGVWTFDGAGNLGLPGGGIIYSNPYTPSGAPGNTITLQPAGSGTTTNQKLMIYPTAGDGDHIHMVTGNLYQTELFLGSDNFFAKLANTGNFVVQTNDNVSNVATYTFGYDGNLNLPGNLTITGLTNIFGSNTALIQTNDDIPLAMISSNVNGTISSVWIENTSDIGNSNIAGIYVHDTGTGAVRIVNGNNATAINIWDFDTTGNLNVPGNILVSGVASPAPYISGFSSITTIDGGNLGGFDFSNSNLTLPGNTFAVNYANGTQVSLGGSYSNADVANYLPTFTGGNIGSPAGGQGVTNLNLAGNIVATPQLMSINWSAYHMDFSQYGRVNLNTDFFANANTIGAQYLKGDGSNISNIAGANISGTISTSGNISGGNLLASANILGNGYARFTGSFDESQASTAGLYVGYAGGTPRMMFGTGNTSQTFEIDNDGGNLRFYQPGSTKATLTSGGNFSVSGNISATNIGNIASANLNGNGSQVFLGNGTFASAPSSSIIANGNSNVTIASSAGNVVTNVNGALALTVSASGIKVSGGGALQSPGGATAITLNNNGANIPTANITTALNVTGASGANITANITVNGTAGVITPNLPAFRVVGTGGQISSVTTVTGSNWTVDFNQGSYLNNSTGEFTAPVAGLYQVNLVVRTYTNTGISSQAVIKKNSDVQIMVEWAANTTMNHTGGSSVVKMAVGDKLTFQVLLGSISFDTNDNWSVAFLG